MNATQTHTHSTHSLPKKVERASVFFLMLSYAEGTAPMHKIPDDAMQEREIKNRAINFRLPTCLGSGNYAYRVLEFR